MAVGGWMEDAWGGVQQGADELRDYWEQIERRQRQQEAEERREAEESFRRANVRQQRMIGGDQWGAGNLGELASPQGGGGANDPGELLERIATTLEEQTELLKEIRDKKEGPGTYGP